MNDKKTTPSDVMLWIDEYLNHRFFEHLVSWNYKLWLNTSQKFCGWICDNFEEEIKKEETPCSEEFIQQI